MAWLSLLPIFIGQFGNVVCQGAELTAGTKNTPGALNALYESGNPVREPMLNEWTMRPLAILGDVHRNLRPPLTDKSQKITPAAGSVASVTKGKRDDGTESAATEKSDDQNNNWVHWLLLFLSATLGGICGSTITLARRLTNQAHPQPVAAVVERKGNHERIQKV